MHLRFPAFDLDTDRSTYTSHRTGYAKLPCIVESVLGFAVRHENGSPLKTPKFYAFRVVLQHEGKFVLLMLSLFMLRRSLT